MKILAQLTVATQARKFYKALQWWRISMIKHYNDSTKITQNSSNKRKTAINCFSEQNLIDNDTNRLN